MFAINNNASSVNEYVPLIFQFNCGYVDMCPDGK